MQKQVAAGNADAFALEKLKSMLDGDARQIERITRLIDEMKYGFGKPVAVRVESEAGKGAAFVVELPS